MRNSHSPQSDTMARASRRGLHLMFGVMLFSIFTNLLMLTGPLFMLQIYDRVLASRSEATLVALFVLVAALYGLMAIIDYSRGRILARYGARFQAFLDDRVFSAVLRVARVQPKETAPPTGLRDLENVSGLFATPVLLAVFDIPWTPVFIAAIFVFHPMLGWLAVYGGVFLIALTLLNALLTRSKSQQAQEASARSHRLAEEALTSADLVHSQALLQGVKSRWHQSRDLALAKTLNASDWTGVFTAFTKSFRLFLQSAILALGAWLVIQVEMTAGAMIASSILLGRALAPIEQSLGQWQQIQRARSSWHAIKRLLSAVPAETEAFQISAPKPDLQITNVTVIPPGASKPTMSGFSLVVEPSQSIGVIGKSGAGKTTLAKLILGLWQPAAGEVRLGGATLTQYRPEDLGKYIGYLPQSITLFTGTVAENIARMAEEPDSKRVEDSAKRAGVHDLILSLPNGYDTILSPQGGMLSGGQMQRLALARALYEDPIILVLDEPNSALDNEGSLALNQCVREFKQNGKVVFMMTHRPSALSECDRLLVIEHGRLRVDGPRDQVLQAILKNSDGVKSTIAKVQNS